MKQGMMRGTGISWTICKSLNALHSRQITMPVPHHSVFTDWMPFLLPNQQCTPAADLLNWSHCNTGKYDTMFRFCQYIAFHKEHRVTTFLENLKMSGNFAAVMEMSGNWPYVRELSGECQGKLLVLNNKTCTTVNWQNSECVCIMSTY